MLRWPTAATPTMNTATARTRRWTYADYCRIPPDRNRHEIVDGRHFVNPAPSPGHQSTTGLLYFELVRLVEKTGKGRVFIAPIDVHLAPGTVVQPDIVVLRRKNASLVGATKITGVPDLLIEVLSPSNRDYDRRIKLGRYERAGVREFWLVDPGARTVEQFVRRRLGYGEPHRTGDAVTLHVMRTVTIDLAEVW